MNGNSRRISKSPLASAERKENDLLEAAAGEKLIFAETRTAFGERAYIVLGAAEKNEPNIVIPARYNGGKVVRIENRAFCGNPALMEVRFSGDLSSIGVFAFAFCGNLTAVSLPDGLASLGGRAFYGCGNLACVSLGKSLKSVRSGLFVGCKSLKELVVPDSVSGIGAEAFAYCENLERLTIGRGVCTIGERAFNECGKLKKICYRGTRESWNRIRKEISSARFLCSVPVQCVDGEIKPF